MWQVAEERVQVRQAAGGPVARPAAPEVLRRYNPVSSNACGIRYHTVWYDRLEMTVALPEAERHT